MKNVIRSLALMLRGLPGQELWQSL